MVPPVAMASSSGWAWKKITFAIEQAPYPGTPLAPRGGPVATAGGLVFVGTSSDRKIRARDADTGKVLWEYELPAATEGVPAVYQAGGREYLVIGVGGDGLFAPKLGQSAPGPSQYMAFALPKAGN